ncbi:Ankyrin repeat and KH domain-containing protein 1 [Taenia crassiceps]|uniref:Ankyrin repeat and KH domain-containing protein 1 n=1 Tax=Taenia crassiceps TaxID=6207 RepID=A0ABR4QF87_9CEST
MAELCNSVPRLNITTPHCITRASIRVLRPREMWDNPTARAMREAIESNDAAALEALFQQDVNPDETQCDDGVLPLLKAASRGADRALCAILQHGVSVTVTDAWLNTALHLAACGGYVSCVHQLLQHGSAINAVNYHGATPLMQAVSAQHIDVVRHLILHDASTTPQLNDRKESALTIACQTGNLGIFELIINVESPRQYRKRELYAALSSAVKGKQLLMVSLLLAVGAPANFPNDTSIEHPLHAAVRSGDVSITRCLLAHGANIEAVDEDGNTPLMVALGSKLFDVICALVENGADINAVNGRTGECALSMVEWGAGSESCDLLLGALFARAKVL